MKPMPSVIKKIKVTALVAALAAGTAAQAQFTPLVLTTNSYNQQMILPNTYKPKASTSCVTVTMDSGPTTNTAGEFQNNTWFEVGCDIASNNIGLPHAGSLVTNQYATNHVYQFAASWTNNNVVFIGVYNTKAQGVAPGYTSGSFVPVTPAAYSAISFLTSTGNGPCVMSVDVYHADGSDDHSTMSSPDWFAGGPTNVASGVSNGTAIYAFSALGRVSITGGFANQGSTTGCILWSVDDPLANTTSPVTNIVLGWISGGRSCNFAVSGATTAGGAFSPIAVTPASYDAMAVVPTQSLPLPITASFDNGTNIATGGANTWFEMGYDVIGVTNGLPLHGATFNSAATGIPYTMAPSYAQPNAILIDNTILSANLVPQTNTKAGTLSFLVSGGNIGSGRPLDVQATIQHQDGVNETNFIKIPDNFNDFAFNAWACNGRVNFSNGRQLNAFNGPVATGLGNNPKMFDSLMPLTDTNSPITNIVLSYYNPLNLNGSTWRGWIFAVSAAPTNSVYPLPPSVLQSVLSTAVGSAATFGVPYLGTPATYQWSSNGTAIAGATSSTYTTAPTLAAGFYPYSVTVTTSAGSTTLPVELLVAPASANLFSTPAAWELNNDAGPFTITTLPSIANNVLQTTDNHNNEAVSAFYIPPVSVNGFLATFTFRDVTGAGADGATFILQNDVRGPAALGGQGGNYGVAGITPSVELEFELYGPNQVGIAYETGAAIIAAGASISNANVYLAGDPINVGIYYNYNSAVPSSSTATISLYDLVTGGNFSTNTVIGDITQSSGVGGTTALVGFTGGTGGAACTQTISNFVYVPFSANPPTPLHATVTPAVASTVAGTGLTLTAAALGTGATYQWANSAGAIAGATNATYTTPTNQALGIYPLSVTVTTSAGTSNLQAAYAVTGTYQALNDPTDWTINKSGTFTITPYVNTNVLATVDNHASEAVAAWYNFQQPLNGFIATWTYIDASGGTSTVGADGGSFCIQNDTRKLTAIGGGGGAIGMTGITPSSEWCFDLYPNNSPQGQPGNGVQNYGGISYQVNGAAATPYYPCGPVPIGSGHQIRMGLYYNWPAGTVVESMVDVVTGFSYVTNIAVGDLTSSIGPLAYVGFTAATGGSFATEVFSNFVFQPSVSTLTVIPPTNKFVAVGQPVTFTVAALAGPPFTFQWSFNGVAIAGATTSTLALSSAQLTNAGSYSIVVTSISLSTNVTSTAVLSVSPSPVATITPALVSIYSGVSPAFTAVAYGSLPLSYQWTSNGTAISGATASTYSGPANLAPGTYTYGIKVTNSSGSVTPTPASLTVVTPSAFAQYVLTFNPLSYWPLNEPSGVLTAYDYVGGNNGAYVNETSVSTGYPGPTEPGFGSFSSGNSCAYFDGSTGYVDVPLHNLNLTNSMSMFAWIQPATLSASKFETFFGHSDNSYRLDIDGTGSYFAHFADNPAGDAIGSTALNDGNWHLVAGVYNSTNGTRLLFVDGLFAAGVTNSATPAGDSRDVIIGGDPGYLPPSGNRIFTGFVADAAIFNYALSPAVVGQIYVASGVPPVTLLPAGITNADQGSSVTITAVTNGTPPLTLQWYQINGSFQFSPVSGQTNATLTLNNLPVTSFDYAYFLVAANAYGSSSNVAWQTPEYVHVIGGPPETLNNIDITPLSQYVAAGGSVFYSYPVYGSLPFTYTWYTNGVAVAGATASTYTFVANAPTNTVYAVARNSAGSLQSLTATNIELSSSLQLLSNPAGWTINKAGTFPTTPPQVSGNTLYTTDNNDNESMSAFLNGQLPINGFTANFTYQDIQGGGADGLTFCLQNSGPTAIGGGGGSLGYNVISPSVAWQINVYSGNNYGGVGCAYNINGALGPDFVPGVITGGGAWPADPINMTIAYNQSTGIAAWTMVDQTTGGTFTTNMNIGDITVTLGGTSAYVGFTAADGGVACTQIITDFTYVLPPPTIPPGPSLTITRASATTFTISWIPQTSPVYTLQQAATVIGPWVNVTQTPTLNAGVDSITVTNTATQFYRLEAP